MEVEVAIAALVLLGAAGAVLAVERARKQDTSEVGDPYEALYPGRHERRAPRRRAGSGLPAARAQDILAKIVSGDRRVARASTPPSAMGGGRPARPALCRSAHPGTVSARAIHVERRRPGDSQPERTALHRRLRPIVWAHGRGQPSRAAPASLSSRAAAAFTGRVSARRPPSNGPTCRSWSIRGTSSRSASWRAALAMAPPSRVTWENRLVGRDVAARRRGSARLPMPVRRDDRDVE
jgi:hypothetical protein